MNKTSVASLGLVAVLAIRSSAAAEGGVALDRYQPSFAGDSLFSAPDAAVNSERRLSGRIDVSYAHAPLVLVERSANGDRELGRLVSHAAIAHYLLSLELLGRLALDLDLPVTLSQAGETSASQAAPSAPSGVTLDDLRLGARVPLLEQAGLAPAVALAGAVFLPTGADNGFSSNGRAGYAIGLDLGSDYSHLLWRAHLSRQRSGESGAELGALLGSGISFGAALAWRQGPLQIGPELFGARALGDAGSAYAPAKTNLELLFGAKYRIGSFVVGAAAGPGLTRAPGTPDLRLLGSLAFAPGAAVSTSARAAAAAGTDTGEHSLALPTARVGSGTDPKDSDADGIFDVDDRCPQRPGVASADPEQYGCPADTDGDGMADPEDACPSERGPASRDPDANGCPAAVRVEGTQIVILQQVSFATGNDTIEASSFDLLAQVAQVLTDHAEIARLAVDGHTDDVGAEPKNLALSRRRAMSVARWLIAHGVDERRIEARGFGPRQPLDPAKTAEARAKNRRVEFIIVKRSPLGTSAWKDGAAE